MKKRIHVIMLLAVSASMLIVIAGGSFAYADSCTASLSYPVIPEQYSNSNVPFVVPISASCTTYYGQLYATGNAYDATTNTALGSANTILSSANGGTQFNGQLGFSLLPASPSDSVQISVSIYGGQGGTLLTQTSETVQVGAGLQPVQQPIQQTTTTTVTVGQYPYANPLPTAYPSPYQLNQSQYYQSQPYPYPQQQLYGGQQYQSHRSHYFSQGFAHRSNNGNLFDYAVIIAIIAAVIVSITALLLIARRPQQPQPVWYPVPPPPPPR